MLDVASELIYEGDVLLSEEKKRKPTPSSVRLSRSAI